MEIFFFFFLYFTYLLSCKRTDVVHEGDLFADAFVREQKEMDVEVSRLSFYF